MTENNQNNQPKSNQRGGKRAGAGRKKSAVTIKTREVAEKVISETPADETPLAIMVRVMRRFWEEAEKKLQSENPDERASGFRLMEKANSAAASAAPYIHPRLASVDHTTNGESIHSKYGVLMVPGVMSMNDWEKIAKEKEKAASKE